MTLNCHPQSLSIPDPTYLFSYKGVDGEKATEDFRKRIKVYEKTYETLDESDADKSTMHYVTTYRSSLCQSYRCWETNNHQSIRILPSKSSCAFSNESSHHSSTYLAHKTRGKRV